MTEEEYKRAHKVIEMAQRIHSRAHGHLRERGIQPIDTAIAGAYAAHQAATVAHGDPFAAIEWMRTTIDTIERQLLNTVN